MSSRRHTYLSVVALIILTYGCALYGKDTHITIEHEGVLNRYCFLHDIEENSLLIENLSTHTGKLLEEDASKSIDVIINLHKKGQETEALYLLTCFFKEILYKTKDEAEKLFDYFFQGSNGDVFIDSISIHLDELIGENPYLLLSIISFSTNSGSNDSLYRVIDKNIDKILKTKDALIIIKALKDSHNEIHAKLRKTIFYHIYKTGHFYLNSHILLHYTAAHLFDKAITATSSMLLIGLLKKYPTLRNKSRVLLAKLMPDMALSTILVIEKEIIDNVYSGFHSLMDIADKDLAIRIYGLTKNPQFNLIDSGDIYNQITNLHAQAISSIVSDTLGYEFIGEIVGSFFQKK